MELKTTYTFIPLPRLAHEPISCRGLNPLGRYSHLFSLIRPLECHVSPPLAVINGGSKLANLDLDAISSSLCHRQGSGEILATKERLILLSSIWDLIMSAKGLAKEWETENRGEKSPRDQDGDDMVRLSQRIDRTTGSIPESKRNSGPTHEVIGGTQPGVISGTRKRKRDGETTRPSTTLNRDVLAQLGKRQKTVDSIKGWIESTAWHLPR